LELKNQVLIDLDLGDFGELAGVSGADLGDDKFLIQEYVK